MSEANPTTREPLWLKRIPPTWRRGLTYLLFGGGGLWFAYNALIALATGAISGRRGTWLLSEDPEMFRLQLAIKVGVAIGGLGLAVLMAIKDLKRLSASRMRTAPLIIAVDGPAASGKGTIAARLARAYGLPHLDTGLLYRAVGLGLLDRGCSLDDAAAAEAVARGLDASHLTDTDRLTDRGAGEAASRVAGHPGVRAALLDFQRAFAARPGGAVLDGRDIGTVIAPGAQAKLFVTATPQVRAMRRWKQLTARGEVIAYDEMLADIIRRDERDAGRGAAPMVQAEDAVLLDTTDMDIETAFDAARRIVEAARAKHGL